MPRLHLSELSWIRDICFRIHESVYTSFDESGIIFCESGKDTNPKSKVRTLYPNTSCPEYFIGVKALFQIRWVSRFQGRGFLRIP